MNKEIFTIPFTSILFALISLGILLGFSTACKNKPDYGKFKSACERVKKCDSTVGKNAALLGGSVVKGCQKMLAKLSTKKRAAGESVVQCLEKTPCEKLSFGTCIMKASLGMPVPGR